MEDADLNQYMRLKKQLIVATEKCSGEGNFFAVRISLIFINLDEELRVADKVVVAVDDQTETFLCSCGTDRQARKFECSSPKNSKKESGRRIWQCDL